MTFHFPFVVVDRPFEVVVEFDDAFELGTLVVILGVSSEVNVDSMDRALHFECNGAFDELAFDDGDDE